MAVIRANSNRYLRRIVLTAAMALASVIAFTASADAAEYEVVGTGGTLHVRTAPSLSAPIVGNLGDGTKINILCQTRGDQVVGSTMWDKINSPVAGYVADWYTSTPGVNVPSSGLPECVPPNVPREPEPAPSPQPQPAPQPQPSPQPSPQPQPAPQPQPSPQPPAPQTTVAGMAESYNGQREIPAAFARTWHVGPHWSGYCEAFVALVAYGGHGRYGTALADYYAHRSKGEIHTGVPPRGAVVYWNPYDNRVGHVGISLGNGLEISTYGGAPEDLPIEIHKYNYFRNYLGWAMP
jgi:hypothetical protein